MFILAFVGIGLFASAGNGKVGGIKLPIKKDVKEMKKSFKNWYVTYGCSPAVTYGPFSSYSGALDWLMDHPTYNCVTNTLN